MVFIKPFYLIIRFTTRPMMHGGVRRQVPRRQSPGPAVPHLRPRRFMYDRDWSARLLVADSSISEGN
jgi:hypothetical protein